MASNGLLTTARRVLLALEAGQSQGSIFSQAEDCAPIVEALGYYDLADHLRRLDSGRCPTCDDAGIIDTSHSGDWSDSEDCPDRDANRATP